MCRHGCLHIVRTGSVLAILVVTVERYFSIVHPHKAIKTTWFLVIISLSASIVYNVPRFFEFETSFTGDYGDGATNATNDNTQSSQLRNMTLVTFCPTLIYFSNTIYINY